jgi:hypothetical protein
LLIGFAAVVGAAKGTITDKMRAEFREAMKAIATYPD